MILDILQQKIADKKSALEKLISDAMHGIHEETRSLLADAVRPLFDKYPELKTIYFSAYTPYWNDGEECSFRVGDIAFSPCEYHLIKHPYWGSDEFDEDDLEEGQQGDFFSYSFDAPEETRISKAAEDDFDNLARALNALGESMKYVVGDHAFVKIHKDGIEVSEYKHD